MHMPALAITMSCTSMHGGRPGEMAHYSYAFSAELFSLKMDDHTWKEVTPSYRQPPSGEYGAACLPEGYPHLFQDHHSIQYVEGMFGGRGL